MGHDDAVIGRHAHEESVEHATVSVEARHIDVRVPGTVAPGEVDVLGEVLFAVLLADHPGAVELFGDLLPFLLRALSAGGVDALGRVGIHRFQHVLVLVRLDGFQGNILLRQFHGLRDMGFHEGPLLVGQERSGLRTVQDVEQPLVVDDLGRERTGKEDVVVPGGGDEVRALVIMLHDVRGDSATVDGVHFHAGG